MRRYCPLENENARPAYNIQEEGTVGQVARAIPRIYAALEEVEVERWLKLQAILMSNLFLF